VHPPTFYANCPINVASQTTSIESGMDKFVLPMLRVIAVSENLDVSATVTLLKTEELTLISVRLDLSQSLRGA
jgi:hypothetical protein